MSTDAPRPTDTPAPAPAPRTTPAVALGEPGVPTWFGAENRRLFGWIHAAHANLDRGVGVVMCNPFGREMLCSLRTYRALAESLAAAGIAALRFDYDGTGDSAGSGEDPDRVGAWRASVDAAIAELKARAGVTRVYLFGFRIGGLLACDAATRAEIEGLVLVGPPASGRSYLRELKAFQTFKDASDRANADATAGAEEPDSVVGYALSPETRAHVAALDLQTMTTTHARRALVVARDDLEGREAKLVERLRGLGVDATLSRTPGYSGVMTDDPYKSIVPMPLVEEIVAWIAAAPASPRVSAHTPIAPVPPVDRARHHTPEGDVSELLVRFADLPGVLTEPIGPRGRSARPAVVLFNVGANHRVGCNRLYVGMARLLATAGFSVLRFDRRTIGDGPHAPGEPENDIYAARSVDEARAAMDFLRDAHGFDRFVLGGLCSGGYVAYHAAIVDERVVGAFLINPLTYDWKLGDSLEVRVRKTFKSTKFYSQALRGTDVWKRALTGQVHVRAVLGELARRAIKRSGTVADDLRARLMRRGRNESDVARNLRRLCDRGVDLFFVFGAADGGIDLIEEHLGPDAKALRRHKRFRMEIIDGPDHTFTPLWSQRHLRLLLRAHLRARFG